MRIEPERLRCGNLSSLSKLDKFIKRPSTEAGFMPVLGRISVTILLDAFPHRICWQVTLLWSSRLSRASVYCRLSLNPVLRNNFVSVVNSETCWKQQYASFFPESNYSFFEGRLCVQDYVQSMSACQVCLRIPFSGDIRDLIRSQCSAGSAWNPVLQHSPR